MRCLGCIGFGSASSSMAAELCSLSSTLSPSSSSPESPGKTPERWSWLRVHLTWGSHYFSITTLIWIEVLVVGYIEFQRNAELDSKKRLYSGGSFFDPLGLASDPEKLATLQLAEIKHRSTRHGCLPRICSTSCCYWKWTSQQPGYSLE